MHALYLPQDVRGQGRGQEQLWSSFFRLFLQAGPMLVLDMEDEKNNPSCHHVYASRERKMEKETPNKGRSFICCPADPHAVILNGLKKTIIAEIYLRKNKRYLNTL